MGRLKMLELFSGVGGFRRGFENAGHTCVGWVEIDKFARKSYEAIWPEAKEEWNREDITAVTDDHLRQLSRDVGGVDVIAFGSPCQDVSVAGRRAGFVDDAGALTRSGLFFEAMRIARILKPKHLVMENVLGLFSSPTGNAGADFAYVIAAFHEVGMEFVEWDVLNALSWGIPQDRDRVFIAGHYGAGSRREIFPLIRDGSEGKAQLQELTSGAADAFRVYDANGIARTQKAEGGGAGAKTGLYRVESDVSKTVRASGQGSYDGKHTWNLVQLGVVRKVEDGETSYSERDVALCIDANYYKGLDAHQARTGVAVYRTSYRSGELECEEVAPDVSPTIRAQHSQYQDPHVRAVLAPDRVEKRQNGRRIKEYGEPMFTVAAQDRHGIETGTRIRRLTPLECWRLFGRADWEFERAKAAGVSDSQLYKQAGNSLVPQIVEAIARQLS